MSADGTVSYLRRARQRRVAGSHVGGRLSQCRAIERNESRVRDAVIVLSRMLSSGEFARGSDEYLQLQQYLKVVAARFARPKWTPSQVANLLHMPRSRFMMVLGDAVDYAEQHG